VRSGIGIGQEVVQPLPAGGLERLQEEEREAAQRKEMKPADMPLDESVDEFRPPTRGKPALPKAPRADTAPIEGQEVRTDLAGGFGSAARELRLEDILAAEREADERDAQKSGGGGDDDDKTRVDK
jgi:hypothetical protein